MSLATSCVLCTDDGGTLVWRNQQLRVVSVDDPDLPGYTRVIWHGHVREMTDLAETDRLVFMQAVFLVENVQRRILRADKVNLASLGNMTPHLHWHIMPRWQGDPWFPDSIWSARHERNTTQAADWRERHEILSTLQGEYSAALRSSLEKTLGPGESTPAHTAPARTVTAPRPTAAEAGTASDNQLRELPGRQLTGLHPGWQAALDTPAARDALARLDTFITQRLQAGAVIYPARVFRALETLGPEDVRVVILGQDPYHGPGQAQGLAFSVPDTCPAPPSLRNIFNELAREYPALPPRRRNDLSDWNHQGVLLLNTSLTVEQGQAGSHARKGWEAVTDALIGAVAATPQPKVFLLWGNHAQSKLPLLEAHGQAYHILKANHPSPLSALRPPRPFIGCSHFFLANAWLTAQGQTAIEWMHPGA